MTAPTIASLAVIAEAVRKAATDHARACGWVAVEVTDEQRLTPREVRVSLKGLGPYDRDTVCDEAGSVIVGHEDDGSIVEIYWD